jgi:hypothetical protein
MTCRPPQRRSDPGDIQDQGARLEGHYDESRQRNRDEVGGNSEKAGLVKMIESEGDERDLDGQSRQDHAEEHSKRPRDRPLVPPQEQPATQAGRMQRDDRRHGGPPLLAIGSTLSTVASKVVTIGRSSRGALTHSERSQIRPHPNAAASPIQPIARSSLPPSKTNPGIASPMLRQRTASHSLRPSSANQDAMPAPKPTTSHDGSWPRSRSRKLSTPSHVA